jgi:hypothetical protein
MTPCGGPNARVRFVLGLSLLDLLFVSRSGVLLSGSIASLDGHLLTSTFVNLESVFVEATERGAYFSRIATGAHVAVPVSTP